MRGGDGQLTYKSLLSCCVRACVRVCVRACVHVSVIAITVFK